MLARYAALMALLLLLLAAGFTGPATAQNPPGPPWPEIVSPNGITLRWYPDEVSEAEAHQVANAHCAPTGRSAALAAIELDGSVEIGSYRCQ